jgi:hypothetical protein
MANLAICLGTENFALSQFTNMPFSSSCVFNGKTLLSNSLGVFELGATTDNGTEIVGSLQTGKMAFGSQHRKRNRASKIYVEAEKSNDLELPCALDVTVSDDSQAATYRNDMQRTGFNTYATKCGRGFDGASLQLQVKSVACTALTIRSIEVELDEIRRRQD